MINIYNKFLIYMFKIIIKYKKYILCVHDIYIKYNKLIIYSISTIINLLIPIIYYLYVFINNYHYINIENGSLVLTNLSIIPTLYMTFYNLNILYPEYILSYPIMFTSGMYNLCYSSDENNK